MGVVIFKHEWIPEKDWVLCAMRGDGCQALSQWENNKLKKSMAYKIA